MNSGGGRVNPAKFFGRLDLLAANRPSDNDVCIPDFFGDAFVVGELNDGELGKLLTQSLHPPERRDPEIEAVMDGDEELHREQWPALAHLLFRNDPQIVSGHLFRLGDSQNSQHGWRDVL